MSWGRDIRLKDLLMVPAEIDGSVEPQLVAPTRQAVRGQVAGRIDDYTPEWTDRRPDDAGVALVRAYGTVAEAVNVRLNRAPRKLALEHLDIAGVRALQARPAQAILAIEVAPRADAPLGLPAGSAFLVPGAAATPVVIETLHGCQAIPGALKSVAVHADGWVFNDEPGELGGMAPFGPRPHVPAELWLGIESPVAPDVLLSIAVEFVGSPGRAAVSAVATVPPVSPPTLRWEAMTSAGATELPVERDDTAGLTQSGVLALRVDTPAPWVPRTPPNRIGDPPLYWLRARLVTNDYPHDRRLSRVTLNGVTAVAARSIHREVLERLERSSTGRSRYRLAQIPVVPGSVRIDVADSSADPFGTQATDDLTSVWREVDDLAGARPEDRVFLLDAAGGVATFGDGVHGRAVPDGYRNVVARVYASGGGSAGLPAPGDAISAQRSIPNLIGATVLTITTGADTETPGELVLRGPDEIISRGRAVAPADYATLALAAEGADIARAHCLAGTDPRSAGAAVPGLVGVIVVPQATTADGPPVPPPEALRAVADHLAREVGVVGAEVVAAAPRYRLIAAQAVLVARAGSDLAAASSAARDAIDAWLNPLHGYDGTGWPFGGPVRWDALTRLLLAKLPALTAVSRLAFRIDGRRLPACVDAVLEPGELTWPATHIIEVVAEERAS
jgi:predicted phage baseplate assembly protein